MVLPDDRGFAYSAVANDGIARALFWRGIKSWESETIPVFYKLARRAELVVDVGANTGVYTMLACAANPRARVVAFEPVARVYNRLVEHVRLNGWEELCQTRNEAVSNIVGIIKMHIPCGDMPVGASLCSGDSRPLGGELVDVRVTTLDAFLKNRRVDLAKIDTEGMENKVLEGMQGILAASSPTLIIECLPDGPYRLVQEILEGYGYRFYHLRQDGPIAVDKIIPDEREIERNFLCVVRRAEIDLT